MDGRARDARILVDDLTREQRKADADVEQVKGRLARDQQRMDSGQLTNPKDLERMQGELGSLARRISVLEDAEIEVMERLEVAQAELEESTARLAEIDTQGRELLRSRDARATEIQSEIETTIGERQASVLDVPADLGALYERLREQKNGVGAAALHRRRCQGCSLDVTAADMSSILQAADDEVLRCEECNRILVRTPESGL